MSNVKSEIIAIEQRLRVAMICSNVAVLDALLSSELIFTNHLGQVISKAEDIAAHRNGDLKIESLDVTEQQVQLLGGTAVVSALMSITGVYKGEPASGDFRFTRVWSQQTGRWQLIAGHSCLVI